MKKFSNQVLLNESTENTYLLDKHVDKFPECWDDVKEFFEVFKESYDDVTDCAVTVGWVHPVAIMLLLQ